MKDLTRRQREVLAIIMATADPRTCAQALSMAYQTVSAHLTEIKLRLSLPDIGYQFSKLAIGDRFRHNQVIYTKVPHCQDRYGGYNAQDEAGQRYLFMRHIMVERLGRSDEPEEL